MDFWWLYLGALALAAGAIYSWLANDWTNCTPTDDSESKLRDEKVRKFNSRAVWANGIGALLVAGGTAISAATSNPLIGVIALIILGAVGVLLIRLARDEGKLVDRINRKKSGNEPYSPDVTEGHLK